MDITKRTLNKNMATRPFSNHDEWLDQSTLDLIDAIHDFAYSVLNPTYNTLGDLHQTLDVELVEDLGNTNPKQYVSRMTVGDLERYIADLKRMNNNIQTRNRQLGQQMELCDDWKQRNAIELQIRPLYAIGALQEILDRHKWDDDDTMVDIPIDSHSKRLGYYTRRNGKGLIVLEYTRDTNKFVSTYIHELMHAFYDADLTTPKNNAEYAEEPLAEYGMLHFINAFVKANRQYDALLQDALHSVSEKRHCLALVHYGFGIYIFQRYRHIEWEKLMRDAHSKIDSGATPYVDLRQSLQGAYPASAQLPQVAQLLHDVLTTACGMSRVTVSSSSSVGGITPQSSCACLYSFRVAGMSHQDANGDYRVHNIRVLNVGDVLTVQEDFSNPYDSDAILLIRPDGREMGFIPNDDRKKVPAAIIRYLGANRLYAVITAIQPEGAFADRYVEVELMVIEERIPNPVQHTIKTKRIRNGK